MNGFTLYDGPSRIGGARIVAIATGFRSPSANRKTGAMVQTWILRADRSPTEAVKTGADAAICGGCPHRGRKGKRRSCYVNVGQAPQGIWRAWKRGSYPEVPTEPADSLLGRMWRLGAYGDPAAIPLAVWTDTLARFQASGHTGYTHQWKSKRLADALELCQASVDSPADTVGLESYFRVTRDPGDLLPGETLCPAYANGTTCLECGLCDASGHKIVVPVHGSGAVHFND